MKKRVLTVIAGIACISIAFAISLNNGSISVEVNGDSRIGALVFEGSNHINECSIRLRHSSNMYDTKRISATEKGYNAFQLMTGYGRQRDSNMYLVTASRIYGTNTSIDQTIVVLTRLDTQLGITYYLNADVQQTPKNDLGIFNGANHTIVQHEGARYIGLLGERNSQPPDSHVIADRPVVESELSQAVLSGTVVTGSPPDMAAAIAWGPVTINQMPVRVTTKLMASRTDGGIQNLTNSDDPPIYVVTGNDIMVKKAEFVQKFNKAGKDTFKMVGEIDMSAYPGIFDNMDSLDVTLCLGDYLAFLPGDGSEVKVKKGKRLHKLDAPNGKRKLLLKSRKGMIKYVVVIQKANLEPATLLNTDSSQGVAQNMLLPVALILTGTNPNDSLKGGKVWIIGSSLPLEYDKKNEKVAKASF